MSTLDLLYEHYGQSPWIDNIRRDWLNDGTLATLVAQGVRGVTSNPSIFAKAVATSEAYGVQLRAGAGGDVEEMFEKLAVNDVRDACDVLARVYEGSKSPFERKQRRYLDGFVSLEVSPRLAHDTGATIDAARRLAKAVARENLMIKIPATREGLAAITEVLSAGISVNVTLIFALERYDQVIDAWSSGIELAASNGHDISTIASVASFFISRVDSAVDAQLEEGDSRRGTAANAQAAKAYQLYRDRMASERVRGLLARGAQVQRPLWASTSTKNPAYYDLLYVDSLVADETVNTMPDATLEGVLDHGDFSTSLLVDDSSIALAAARLDDLIGTVSLDAVTDRLETEGVQAFITSYDELLATVATKMVGIG